MQSESRECIEFGRRLRYWRLARGLSQEQLAHAAGLDRTYISSCEAGRRNVTIKTISRLAEALRISPGALVAEPESRAAEEGGHYGPDA